MIHLIPQILAPILLILLLTSKGHSQLPDYHVQLFDESMGFRTDMERVVKDDLGFVWLMYYDRVQRFDGKQLDEFFIDDRIASILSDRNSQVWVSSRTHVYKFENSKKGFVRVDFDGTDNPVVGTVFQMPDKEVWVISDLGFYAFDKKEQKFFPVRDSTFIPETPVVIRRYCFSVFENIFYYSTKDTIWSHDVQSGIKLHLPVNELSGIYALNKSQVIVTTWKSQTFLYNFEKHTIESISPQKFLHHILDDFLTINAVINLDDHRHLLATSKGLLEFNSFTGNLILKQLFFKGRPLSLGGRILDLYMDGDRRVWAGSEYSLVTFDPFNAVIGLIRSPETDFSKTFSNQIRNFAADEKGNLWLATYNGIAYWDLQKNTFQPFFAVEGAQDRMNHPSIRGIQYDGKNVIIGQSNRGVWLFNPIKKVYRRPIYEAGVTGDSTKHKLEKDFIDQIYRLQNGNYFIAARDGGYIMQAKTYLIRQVKFPGSKDNLNFCYEDRFRQVWIGTYHRVYCLDSNFVYKFAIEEGIGTGVPRCLYQWDDQEYILGGEGLYQIRISDGRIETTTLDHYFDHIFIHIIYRDLSDRLWLGTDEGIFCYNRHTGYIESFDQFDNIQGNYYYPNSVYSNSDGLLFMGGTNGANYFYPDKIETRKDSLKVSLMSVSVNEDDTSYYDRSALLSLRPFQNSIEIEYVAPYYGNTNRLQYRYKLEGLTDAWNHVGHNSTVRFTSLSPGRYTFRIAASVNGISWHEGEESLSFNISFPFWQTWWFILATIISTTAIVLFLVKQRIRFIRRQENEKREREVELITMNRDLAASQLTALRAQMNPHFIFNALNSIQRYILKGDVDQANKYLSKFSRLQREVLNNSSLDFISLDKEIEILDLYLQLEQSRFNENFTYGITVDDSIDTDEIKIPPMILQPFVENAIWHGLMPRQGPKRVDILFALNGDEQLHCRIQDNGIGRAASARLKQNQEDTLQHQSKGMSLVHERLRILEQLYQHPYQVEIVDRTDTAGVVEGTVVNVTLFVGR